MDRDNYKKAVEQAAHSHYMDFVSAYDEVEISDLSDKDLQDCQRICLDIKSAVEQELKKRTL